MQLVRSLAVPMVLLSTLSFAAEPQPELLVFPDRASVPEAGRWNLGDIFESPAAFREAMESVREYIPQVEAHQGTLGDSPEALATALDLRYAVASAAEDLLVYASQWQHTDTRDTDATAAQQQAAAVAARLQEATSFFAPEIAAIPPATLAEYLRHPLLEPYTHLIGNITRMREHIRSDEVEAVVAAAGLVQAAPGLAYSALADADIEWPTVKGTDGEDLTATPSLFYTFMASDDRRLRREAAAAIFGTYDRFGNTFAATLAGSIQKDVWLARTHRYDSSFAAALDATNVPRTVPDRLVETVRANTGAIHRYVDLRKQVLGLEDFHLYDLYVSLVPESDRRFTFDQGFALAMEFWQDVFGEEYAAVAQRARSERWIDVYTSPGKRGGAYSWGSYNTHPYLFLNWGGTLGDVFTLVHEMGHSIHSYLANTSNPYHDADYTLFVAEVASVAAESMFFEWMMERTTDPQQRLAMLHHRMNSITGTFLRQIFFHEFEVAAHAAAERGEALTKESLGGIWSEIWTTYYGPEATLDDWYRSGWARIPHYYRSFYVWVYASSFAAGESIAARLGEGDEAAVDDYLAMLRLGGSVDPMDALERAGVDITDPAVIGTVMERYRALVEEMEALLLDRG